jgi:short-subunit dehydrogenase
VVEESVLMQGAYLPARGQRPAKPYAAAMGEPSRAVLITGCSSGIGHATALRLARSGWTVYASARRPESILDLGEAGCRTLALDVTDEGSMCAAVEQIELAEGAIGVLVNNAGYSQSGAIETVPMEAVRRQFETNVFGLVRLTQLVAPRIRAQRWGRIVNIGSMGFGIDVILLEPGLITTAFGDTASASMAESPRSEDDSYARFNATVATVTKEAYEGPMRLLGDGPDRVAKVIERAITRRRPPARITVTPSAKLTLALRHLLSDRAWEAVMRRQFPQPE